MWWLKLSLFILLVLGAFGHASPKCPVKCQCVVSNTATCTSLDIEPLPAGIVILHLKDLDGPITLSGAVLKKLRLTQLRQLLISDAVIRTWDASVFTDSEIESLVVHNSSVPSVTFDLFKHSTSLRHIDLTESRIARFEGIESPFVEDILMTGCGVGKVPKDAFSHLPALVTLGLEQNGIEEINVGLISAQQINLSRNLIQTLTIAPAGNEHPLSLTLNENPLSAIRATPRLRIEELHLRSCKLTNLDFVDNFPELTHLDVSENLLSEISEKVFASHWYLNLQTLDLSANGLKSLPANFHLLTSLSVLTLDRNAFETLPVLELKTPLDTFSCNDCDLKLLHPDTFKYLRTVKHISLSANHLQSLPKGIFDTTISLQRVDLSNNKLQSLSDELFAKNSDLKTVSLGLNPLGQIDAGIFRHNPLLDGLDVKGCSLKHLWSLKTNTTLKTLRILLADDNRITNIKLQEVKVAPVLETLSLRNNELACTSENRRVSNWLNINGITLQQSTLCLWDPPSGGQLHPKSLQDIEPVLDEDDLDDDDEYFDEEDKDDLYTDEEEEIGNNIEDVAHPHLDIDEEDDVDDIGDDNAVRKLANDILYPEMNRHRDRKDMLIYLLPTLVFVLTALLVLLLTVSAILCLLQKRNGRPTNAPQINIIPWSTSSKMKKHSGSIYRPLSEEYIPV